MPAKKTALVLAKSQPIKILPAVLLHNQFHRNAMLSSAQAACWIVMAGVELQRVKKTLKHGQWEAWVDANCEFSICTAQHYRKVAEGVRDKALRNASKTELLPFLELLDTPASTLTAEQQIRLLKSVHNLTEGETLQELYLDFGIIKGDKKRKGGKTTKGEGSDEADEKPAGWSEEDWQRYLKLPDEQREAVDLSLPRIEAIEYLSDLELSPVPHLPARERRRLEAAHRRLGEILSSLQ